MNPAAAITAGRLAASAFATERITLEPLGTGHREALRPLLEDPLVARTLAPSRRPPAPGLEPEALAEEAGHWERHGFGLWLLRDRTSGEMIGRGGLRRTGIDERWEVSLMWAIVPERWRQGYERELARACVELAFGELSLPSIVALARSDDLSSRAVMTDTGLIYERETVQHGVAQVLYRLRHPEL
jgi:RimJ/RimL family protein N-acetyltransferase